MGFVEKFADFFLRPFKPRGFGQYDRVLHFHIQKSGGTSINHAFYALTYNEGEFKTFLSQHSKHPFFGSPEFLERPIGRRMKARARRTGKPAIGNGYIVSSSWKRIRLGLYSFAHSHMYHENVPIYPRTYSFSIFRDPVERLISRYKMDFFLLKSGKIDHYKDRASLASSVSEPIQYFKTLKQLAPFDFYNQILSFSKNKSVDEAVSRVSSLSRILFQDSLEFDFEALRKDLELEAVKLGKSKDSAKFLKTEHELPDSLYSDSCLDFLKTELEPEFELLRQIKPSPNIAAKP